MQLQRVLCVPAHIIDGTSQYMGFYLLVKCPTVLQTLWNDLKHHHIREALSFPLTVPCDFLLVDLTQIKS